MTIEVVMTTFNGAKYISHQIESILDQLGDGCLIVSDDGSTDDTIAILEKYSQADRRIKILHNGTRKGVIRSFSLLLENTTADYVFLSDQDDIWIPGRLDRMMRVFKDAEKIYGDVPILLHTDLMLVDSEGNIIQNSMRSSQNINFDWDKSFNLLISQNTITGCACLLNRSLLNLALPIPAEADMHDFWLGLVACAFGKVISDDRPSIKYRQHDNNTIGVKNIDLKYFFKRLISLIGEIRSPNYLNDGDRLYQQANAFSKRYGEYELGKIAYEFSRLPKQKYFLRIGKIIQRRFYKNGIIANLSWIIRPRVITRSILRRL